jgi:hypothetical protein
MHIDIRALLEEAPDRFRVSGVSGLVQRRPAVGGTDIRIGPRFQEDIQDIAPPLFDSL